MNFNSLDFLLFFPLVLLLYYRLPQQHRWVLLLVASYYFYMRWNPWLVFLILGTTGISYLAAARIAAAKTSARRTAWLVATLAVCLGCLFTFKYLDFFWQNITGLAAWLGFGAPQTGLQLLLPVGISFYTFQTLSYVIDVYRGHIAPEPHFGYYALFVCFFPQLVAGPIERPENLLPQLHAAPNPRYADVALGLRFMLSGFFKKVVVADSVAPFVEQVYQNPATALGPQVVAATVLFALQIYCDFSGYSEIAIGAAQMLGIRLMTNFDRPYSATSLKEFWRRWHISLSSWLADYLYIPLGGSRKGRLRQCLNLMVVFVASGLWHGANWTFVVWGALHGVFRVLETLLQAQKRPALLPPRLSKCLRHALTFGLVCFVWVFFRAASLADALALLAQLGSGWQLANLSALFSQIQPLLLVLMLAVLRQLPRFVVRPAGQTLAETAANALVCFVLISAIALGWLNVLSQNGTSAFLYFQF